MSMEVTCNGGSMLLTHVCEEGSKPRADKRSFSIIDGDRCPTTSVKPTTSNDCYLQGSFTWLCG